MTSTESIRKPRVVWTYDEEHAVIHKLAQLVIKFGLNHVPAITGARTSNGIRYFGMIKMAQAAVLPEHRRKFMMARVNVPPGFDARVAQAVASMLAEAKKPAPAPESAVAAKAESAPEPQRVVVNVQHGRTPLADYKEDELAVEILRRMLAKSFKLDAVSDQLHALVSRVGALELKAAE